MFFFKFSVSKEKKSACDAKERLQFILVHERQERSAVELDYLPDLHLELIAVISKYIKINPEDIKVQKKWQETYEVLEVQVELPDKRLN
jgi:cell division topological specificity factor